jgi:hypothetical protein
MKSREYKLPKHGLNIAALAAAAILLPSYRLSATELDLQANTSGYLNGAYFTRDATHTSGTGVVNPFLTIERQGGGNTEEGYNTSGGLVLDTQRPTWNRNLQLNELQTFSIAGTYYYKFILDANEPGNNKSLISIDNIRVYTSPVGSQTTANPDALGTLRYALNDPLKNSSGSYIIDNWVKLDAAVANGPGSGYGDMAAYIPTSAFAGVNATDYVYFYNLNGVHYGVDSNLASQAGFEEWWAVTGPSTNVPDAGGTLVLLGGGLLGLAAVGNRFRRANA